MNDRISFDPSVTASTGVNVDALAVASQTQVMAFRDVLLGAGACWGGDQYGAAFGTKYLPSATASTAGVVARATQLTQLAANLLATAESQTLTETTAIEAARKLR